MDHEYPPMHPDTDDGRELLAKGSAIATLATQLREACERRQVPLFLVAAGMFRDEDDHMAHALMVMQNALEGGALPARLWALSAITHLSEEPFESICQVLKPLSDADHQHRLDQGVMH